MSKYTTQVRYICETESGLLESQGFNSVDKIIADSRAKIFNFEYEIFDPSYKPVIETKILKHYYTREICAETVGLWKLYLERRMQEIMPYYNKLYEAEKLRFNPFYDVDITKTGERSGDKDGNIETSKNEQTTISNNSTSTSEQSGNNLRDIDENHWDYYSDTPQGSVGNLDNLTYLTNARHNTSDDSISDNYTNETSAEENRTGNSSVVTGGNSVENVRTTEEYTERIAGKTGGVTYSKMLMEYRQSLINIDMLIIDELSDLFFGLW